MKELQTGEYKTAYDTVVDGLARYSWSVRMRLLGIEAARMTGDTSQANTWQTEIADQAGRAPWRYSDADNLVALGRMAVGIGADARSVLETFYDRALKQHPQHRDAMLASMRQFRMKPADGASNATGGPAIVVQVFHTAIGTWICAY